MSISISVCLLMHACWGICVFVSSTYLCESVHICTCCCMFVGAYVLSSVFW